MDNIWPQPHNTHGLRYGRLITPLATVPTGERPGESQTARGSEMIVIDILAPLPGGQEFGGGIDQRDAVGPTERPSHAVQLC